MLAEKFTEDTPLPLPGSVGYLTRTGQRARVQRNNGDGTALVQLFERQPGTDKWVPVPGSTGNTTIDTVDLHATIKAAVNAGLPKRRKSKAKRRAKKAAR